MTAHDPALSKRDLLFTVDEFRARLAKLQQRLRQAGAAVAIFDELEAMFWIAGYTVSENRWRCCVVPAEGEPFFFLRSLDVAPLLERSWLTDVVSCDDWENSVEVLAAELARRGYGNARIGLDYGSYCMPLRRFSELQGALPGASFVDLGNVVWELRLYKSQAEIAYLRKAGAVADEAMRRAVETVRVGSTERTAAALAASSFVELGAEAGKVGPITSGAGWGFLHGHLHDHSLKTGDIVHMELVPQVNGYSGRLMRSTIVGKATPRQKEVAKILAEAQDRQIAAMVPGASARAVDAILREAVLSSGLLASYPNISGYTLGYYHPAGPRTSDFTRIFHPKVDWVLEPDMVFHMYVSAEGLAFSESVLVTDAGPERLTRLERVLYERE